MNFLPFLIVKRLDSKQKKNYMIIFISILSKIGISISVFALIVSFSAFNGFQVFLNQKILSTLPHGIIQFTDQSFLKYQDIMKKLLLFPEITYCEPYVTHTGFLIKNNEIKLIEVKSFSDIKYLKKKFFYIIKKLILYKNMIMTNKLLFHLF